MIYVRYIKYYYNRKLKTTYNKFSNIIFYIIKLMFVNKNYLCNFEHSKDEATCTWALHHLLKNVNTYIVNNIEYDS